MCLAHYPYRMFLKADREGDAVIWLEYNLGELRSLVVYCVTIKNLSLF